jgi:hypothetical protein
MQEGRLEVYRLQRNDDHSSTKAAACTWFFFRYQRYKSLKVLPESTCAAQGMLT